VLRYSDFGFNIIDITFYITKGYRYRTNLSSVVGIDGSVKVFFRLTTSKNLLRFRYSPVITILEEMIQMAFIQRVFRKDKAKSVNVRSVCSLQY